MIENPAAADSSRRSNEMKGPVALLLPFIVVLAGVAWGRFAFEFDLYPLRELAILLWKLGAFSAIAIMLISWLRLATQLRADRSKRAIVSRLGLSVAMIAIVLGEPFMYMDNAFDFTLAATLMTPFILVLLVVARSRAWLTAFALSLFVMTSVACITHNSYADRWGAGFWCMWMS